VATTTKAIEAMAAVTGIPRVTVERAAVILRTESDDLWPTGGRGGGIKAARPKVSHLVNLGLAIFAADPLNEAPDLVLSYRKLVPEPPSHLVMLATLGLDREAWARSEERVSKVLDQLCPGQTLGDMLDRLVRHLMSAENRDYARENLWELDVWRFRFAGGAIGASFRLRDGWQNFKNPCGGLFPPMEEGLEDPRIPASPPLDRTSMRYKLFETMADLALDTERELGQSVSSDAADETAA
jgi:hypothetical protein